MSIHLLVLAGGFASRIHPLTQYTPKVLLPINGKPFVNYQLGIFKKNQLNQITFCLGHLGMSVKDHVESINGSLFKSSFKICYSYDGETSLGTGGAIANALSTFEGNFAITYGDSYLTENLQRFIHSFVENNYVTQISVTRNVRTQAHRNVEIRNSKVVEISKNLVGATHAEYGFSVVNRERYIAYVLKRDERRESKTFDLIDFFKSELDCDQLKYMETPLPFWEIGSYDGIDDLSRQLQEE